MNQKRTLRSKLIIGFFIVTAPLIFALFYNNLYSMNVVRAEVTQSYSNFLDSQVTELDRTLQDTSNYILRLASSDFSYTNLIPLTLYDKDSGEYFMAKQWLLRKFEEDLSLYKGIETFFVYSKKYDDMIINHNTYEDTQKQEGVLFSFFGGRQIDLQNWQIVKHGDKYYLIRVVQISPKEVNRELYVGALIDIGKWIEPLHALKIGNNEKELLLTSDEGVPLLPSTLPAAKIDELVLKLKQNGPDYISFSKSPKGTKYLLAGIPFRHVPMRLSVFIPEKVVLQKLIYFQRLLFLIPAGLVVILACYLLFVKQVMLKPMNSLIKGMRRITRGDLDVRLEDDSTREYSFLIQTFNHMAMQIQRLKINVYEEMLKAQKAEFNHLQAQINPHFYLNALNVIYSLSVVEKNDLVQKMTKHLVDYFRFITRSHRDTIELSEEIGHIRNYLEIQRLRFPNKLGFSISIPETYSSYEVFPLMIQPFVENAIIHGMEKGKESFQIDIEVRASDAEPDGCEVLIADNGKGFAPEKLAMFQAGQYAEGKGADDKHLGIWNVHHRLRMKYGPRAAIAFENGPEKGAMIRLTIPEPTKGGSLDV